MHPPQEGPEPLDGGSLRAAEQATDVAHQTPCRPVLAGCNSSSPSAYVPGEASRARKTAATKVAADLHGEVLLALRQLRLATPRRLKALLLPHQQAELLILPPRPAGRPRRSRRLRELAPTAGRTTGKRTAAEQVDVAVGEVGPGAMPGCWVPPAPGTVLGDVDAGTVA